MLHLYTGYPPANLFGDKFVQNLDFYFRHKIRDFSVITSDFGRRVVSACLDVTKVLSPTMMRVFRSITYIAGDSGDGNI